MIDLDETTLASGVSEKILIGAVGHNPDAADHLLAAVPPGDFYDPHRSAVWSAFRDLSGDRKPITPVTVSRRLADTDQLTGATRRVIAQEMADFHPITAAEQHAPVITDLARRRELTHTIKAAAGIVANHPGDHTQVLADIREKFNQLDSGADESAGTLTWAQLLDEFETAQAPTATPEGITSPWPDLDAFTGGLFGGRMYTIGGAPGDGKSTVALNLAIHAARAGKSVLVFSKEMPTVDVTGRLVAGGAEIDLRVINARNLDDDDRARFRQFRARTRHLKLRVNADQVSMTQIKQIARGVHHRTGLDLLVVDYLQLMTGNERGRSAEEEIANISTGLKQLAMELDVAVVVPAQLNRNHTSRPDQRPTKADLRGSGRIEQDSDVVILLWRPLVDGQPDRYQVVFIIDKNRHGPKGEIKLRWNGGYGVIS